MAEFEYFDAVFVNMPRKWCRFENSIFDRLRDYFCVKFENLKALEFPVWRIVFAQNELPRQREFFRKVQFCCWRKICEMRNSLNQPSFSCYGDLVLNTNNSTAHLRLYGLLCVNTMSIFVNNVKSWRGFKCRERNLILKTWSIQKILVLWLRGFILKLASYLRFGLLNFFNGVCNLLGSVVYFVL